MFNNINRTKASVLYVAFMAATNALSFATEAAAEAPDVPKGNGGEKPQTSFQAKRQIVQPAYDIDKMNEAEVREALRKLQAQQQTGRLTTRSFRFNDGTDPTQYNEGDKILDANGRPTGQVAKGGEVKSPRDSGTISVYGWQRNPISLYPNQWLEVIAFSRDIVDFIAGNYEHINKHLRTRPGGKDGANDVNMDLANELITMFDAAAELSTLRGQIRAYDPELLTLFASGEVETDKEAAENAELGIIHSKEVDEEAEVGTGETA